jgi:hypothetical protein
MRITLVVRATDAVIMISGGIATLNGSPLRTTVDREFKS